MPFIIQNGMSAPIFSPKFISSLVERFALKILFKAINVPAPSVLPPARPASIGIFFEIFIVIPGFLILVYSKNSSAHL